MELGCQRESRLIEWSELQMAIEELWGVMWESRIIDRRAQRASHRLWSRVPNVWEILQRWRKVNVSSDLFYLLFSN